VFTYRRVRGVKLSRNNSELARAGPSRTCAIEPSPCRGVYAAQDDAELDRVQARHHTPRQQRFSPIAPKPTGGHPAREARLHEDRARSQASVKRSEVSSCTPDQPSHESPGPPVGGRRNESRAYRKRARLRRSSGDSAGISLPRGRSGEGHREIGLFKLRHGERAVALRVNCAVCRGRPPPGVPSPIPLDGISRAVHARCAVEAETPGPMRPELAKETLRALKHLERHPFRGRATETAERSPQENPM